MQKKIFFKRATSNDFIFMLYEASNLWCNKDYCSYIYVMDCLVVNVHLEQPAPFWFHDTSACKILFIPELHFYNTVQITAFS